MRIEDNHLEGQIRQEAVGETQVGQNSEVRHSRPDLEEVSLADQVVLEVEVQTVDRVAIVVAYHHSGKAG